MCLPRGCLPRGVSVLGGVSAWECLPRGVCTPVNRITDRCTNITFPQLRLRAVISISPDVCVMWYSLLLLCSVLVKIHSQYCC